MGCDQGAAPGSCCSCKTLSLGSVSSTQIDPVSLHLQRHLPTLAYRARRDHPQESSKSVPHPQERVLRPTFEKTHVLGRESGSCVPQKQLPSGLSPNDMCLRFKNFNSRLPSRCVVWQQRGQIHSWSNSGRVSIVKRMCLGHGTSGVLTCAMFPRVTRIVTGLPSSQHS